MRKKKSDEALVASSEIGWNWAHTPKIKRKTGPGAENQTSNF